MVDQSNLLSFAEAKAGGEAMYDQWIRMDGPGSHAMGEDLPPMPRDDTGWADAFRAGWEAVWAIRRGA